VGTGTVGKPAHSQWLDEALERAWALARDGGHSQLGTCHLLLGLLEFDSGGMLYLLDLLRINLAEVRFEAEQALQEDPGSLEPALAPPPGQFPEAPEPSTNW
jgi:ATP-dependent Clp protease ATP-binding subunit ClpA